MDLSTDNNKKRIKNRNMIIVFLIIMLIISVGYMAKNYYLNQQIFNYNKGFQDGVISIINTIRSESSIPFLFTSNNQTQINWMPIENVCKGA